MGRPVSLHVVSTTTDRDGTELWSSDRGQRFEVRALDDEGKAFVVGWTDHADGGAPALLVRRHPLWRLDVIVDRWAAQPREELHACV